MSLIQILASFWGMNGNLMIDEKVGIIKWYRDGFAFPLVSITIRDIVTIHLRFQQKRFPCYYGMRLVLETKSYEFDFCHETTRRADFEAVAAVLWRIHDLADQPPPSRLETGSKESNKATHLTCLPDKDTGLSTPAISRVAGSFENDADDKPAVRSAHSRSCDKRVSIGTSASAFYPITPAAMKRSAPTSASSACRDLVAASIPSASSARDSAFTYAVAGASTVRQEPYRKSKDASAKKFVRPLSLLGLPQELQDGIFDFAYPEEDFSLCSRSIWAINERSRLRQNPASFVARSFRPKVCDFMISKLFFQSAFRIWIRNQHFRIYSVCMLHCDLVRGKQRGIFAEFVTRLSIKFWSVRLDDELQSMPSLLELNITLSEDNFEAIEPRIAWRVLLTKKELNTVLVSSRFDELSGLKHFRLLAGDVIYAQTQPQKQQWKDNVAALEQLARPYATRARPPMIKKPSTLISAHEHTPKTVSTTAESSPPRKYQFKSTLVTDAEIDARVQQFIRFLDRVKAEMPSTPRVGSDLGFSIQYQDLIKSFGNLKAGLTTLRAT